jgi:acetamidase/formamidase
MPTHHTLALTAESLHGVVDRALPPAITLDPGDRLSLQSLDAMWCAGKPVGDDWPIVDHPHAARGHALSGPVFVRGAMPGQTLSVSVEDLIPADWGWTRVWLHPDQQQRLGIDLSAPVGTTWTIDPAASRATDDTTGDVVSIRPFLGWMGNAPAASGSHSTTPPRITGGNLDCREIIRGTTLLLPIEVEGALFSCGDAHALQGDGEVCGTALECPMQRIDLTFNLIDRPIPAPHVLTPTARIALGIGSTLDDATTMALRNALDWLTETHTLTRARALQRASLHASLRITQIVNQTVGVHIVLPTGDAKRGAMTIVSSERRDER